MDLLGRGTHLPKMGGKDLPGTMRGHKLRYFSRGAVFHEKDLGDPYGGGNG